jgi:hypothetical protein
MSAWAGRTRPVEVGTVFVADAVRPPGVVLVPVVVNETGRDVAVGSTTAAEASTEVAATVAPTAEVEARAPLVGPDATRSETGRADVTAIATVFVTPDARGFDPTKVSSGPPKLMMCNTPLDEVM